MSAYPEQKQLHSHAPYRSALLTYPLNLQQALRDAVADPSKTLFGVAQGIPSVFVTKLMAQAKPDFIFIDVEHGMYDRLVLHDCIHAAMHHSEGKTAVIVRVPKRDEVALTTALDAGAAGIIIPHSESAQEVKDFMKEVYYPPLGHRSFSPWTFTPGVHDASLYPNDPFNMTTSNKHVCIIPQIESVKGIENVEEIANVPGVNALMFGPGDYMADAGIPLALGGVPDPRLLEAMGKFATAGHKAGVPLLSAAQTMEQVPQLISGGFKVICVVFDVWHISGLVAGNLSKARQMLAEATAAPAANGAATTNGTTTTTTNGVANGTASQDEQMPKLTRQESANRVKVASR